MISGSIDLKVLIYNWTVNTVGLYTGQYAFCSKGGVVSFGNELTTKTLSFTSGDPEFSNIIVTANLDASTSQMRIYANRSAYTPSEDVAVSGTALVQHLFMK